MATAQANTLEILAANGTPDSIIDEMERRLCEISGLNKESKQIGTTAPQLFSSLSAFVANPSTVSVETYKRMIDTDETIGAGIDFMTLALLARFGEYKHENPKIEKFVRRALNDMDGSWHENLSEMFTCEWAGFSTTEVVWKFDRDFDGAAAWVPRKLVTYQPLTIVFAVDQSGDILPNGIYQYQRYYGQPSQVFGGLSMLSNEHDGFRPDFYAGRGDFAHPIRMGANLSYNVIQIDRDKCINLLSSSTGKFGNPYGRSILRRCYKAWVAKDTALKLWIIAMDRKASPLLVGYAPPNDTVLGVDQYGDMIAGQRADVAMMNTLANVHNESSLVFPGKKGEQYDIEAIQAQADMSVFKDNVEYQNKAIMRGLLIPPLILGGDGGGSFALGDAHRQIFQQVCDGKLKPLKQAILEQFVRKIITYNFPEDQWKQAGLGDFVVEEYDYDAMEKLAGIYSSLTTNGYMSPSEQSDMDVIAQKFSLPKRKARESAPVDDGLNFLGPDDEQNNPLGDQ